MNTVKVCVSNPAATFDGRISNGPNIFMAHPFVYVAISHLHLSSAESQLLCDAVCESVRQILADRDSRSNSSACEVTRRLE